MIVIADTSPLNYLVRLGHQDLLREVYGRVVIPAAVLQELKHAAAPQDVRLWAFAPPAWLEEQSVLAIDQSLAPELGAGEHEAISLALELRAESVIDDRAGREQAISRGIPVAGTLAVLLQASLLGDLDFPTVLTRLKQFGFRASRSVEAVLLTRWEAARFNKP